MADPDQSAGLASSLEEIFRRLDAWRAFPKYALERRLDIFLTPFLEPYLSQRMEAPVVLVAPEFPLKRDGSAQSTNVDYLLHRGGGRPAWVFLELKTDARSLSDEQLATYVAARQRGFQAVVDDIERDILPNTRQREKYRLLLETVRSAGSLADAIEIAYLSPERPHTIAPLTWFSFGDFATWSAPVHQELWSRLRPLVSSLHVGTAP